MGKEQRTALGLEESWRARHEQKIFREEKLTQEEMAKLRKTEKVRRELAEDVDLLDTVLTSLVELLEEKDIVTHKGMGETY